MKAKVVVTLVAGLASLTLARAAEPHLIGLVEIPELFGPIDPNGPPGQAATRPSPIRLHAEPRADSRIVVIVRAREEIPSREHGYEELSAEVFAVEKGWYQVGAPGKRGWLPPRHAGKFRSLETLLRDSLPYLTDDWDQKIWDKPNGASRPVPIQKEPVGDYPSWQIARAGALVLDSRTERGELWLEVQVFAPDKRCLEANFDLPPTHKGWVPAYARNGRPNLWYYSRGC